MSLFSLIQEERNVLNSQSFFESALTGHLVGKYGVDHFLNKSQIYVKAREIFADFFSVKLCPQLDPISDQISEQLVLNIKQGNPSQKFLPGIAKRAIALTLEPFYKSVVKKSVRIFVQKRIEDSFDAVCEKGINLATIAAIYHIAVSALKCPVLNKHGHLKYTIDYASQYLPSPAYLLSALTAFHVAAMVHVIWKTGYINRENTSSNKEEVKKLIIDHTKHPVKATLEEKRTFRALRYALSEKKIDSLISFLINELIDHCHWENLHQIRILNIPLVS